MKKKEILICLGTRPEIIKMAPVIQCLRKRNIKFKIVYSGQHYDYNLSKIFIEELGLPPFDLNLSVKEPETYLQLSKMIKNIGEVIRKMRPKIILVQGDTNTVLAASIAANRLKIEIGHIEAGLRSFDLRMEEEHNRKIVDHISHYLFVPTEKALNNLKRENVQGKIFLTGNTIIDACKAYFPLAKKKSKIMGYIKEKEYILVTLHRAENVDNPLTLKTFIYAILRSPYHFVIPLHPRTRKMLEQMNLWRSIKDSSHIQIFPPLGYFDFLVVLKNSSLVITDSGGVQEEVTFFKNNPKYVLIPRISTERTELIDSGLGELVGTNQDRILSAITRGLKKKISPYQNSPFGDGRAGERIVNILIKHKL